MNDCDEKEGPLHWAAGYSEEKSVSESRIRTLEEIERAYIEMVITTCRGNIAYAAELLEVSPSTIYRKLSRWRGRAP